MPNSSSEHDGTGHLAALDLDDKQLSNIIQTISTSPLRLVFVHMAAYNSYGLAGHTSFSYPPLLPQDPRALPSDPHSNHSFHHESHPPPQMGGNYLPGPPLLDPLTFDPWAEIAKGAELQAEILAKDGYTCLDREEYQFSDIQFATSTSCSSQKSIIPQLSMSSPPYSDSPDSIPSQDGSEMSPGAYPSYKSGSKSVFKCKHPRCRYAASRQDHVRDHFKAHHEGNYYQCSSCPSKYVYRGDFDSHPCNARGKETNITCTRCGSIVNRKGLNRHKETIKCKNKHLARPIDR